MDLPTPVGPSACRCRRESVGVNARARSRPGNVACPMIRPLGGYGGRWSHQATANHVDWQLACQPDRPGRQHRQLAGVQSQRQPPARRRTNDPLGVRRAHPKPDARRFGAAERPERHDESTAVHGYPILALTPTRPTARQPGSDLLGAQRLTRFGIHRRRRTKRCQQQRTKP